jgi:oligopeptide/dipeptide ABC transporter ATP-binding protein
MGELKERLGIGVVLISHNLGVIADVAQEVMIMYAGRPVEIGTRDQVFREPRHPYAWGLLESIPRPDVRVERLQPIEGSPPSLIHVPPGCAFHPRCPHRFEPCDRERPDLIDASGTGHPDACHLSSEEKVRLWAERRARFAEAAA